MTHAANYVTVVLSTKDKDASLMIQAKLTVASAYLEGTTKKDYMAEVKKAFTVTENGKEVIAKRFLTPEAYATRAWAVVLKMPGVAEVWAKDGGGISLNDAYAKCPKKANVGRTKKSAVDRALDAESRLTRSEKVEYEKRYTARRKEYLAACVKYDAVQKSLSVATSEV